MNKLPPRVSVSSLDVQSLLRAKSLLASKSSSLKPGRPHTTAETVLHCTCGVHSICSSPRTPFATSFAVRASTAKDEPGKFSIQLIGPGNAQAPLAQFRSMSKTSSIRTPWARNAGNIFAQHAYHGTNGPSARPPHVCASSATVDASIAPMESHSSSWS